MDLKILPNEVYVVDRGALIQTRCPKDYITDQMVHQRVLAANLSAGDFVKVQCFNHERTTILYYTEYLVYGRSSEMKRVEINDRDTRQFEDVKYSILRTMDWKATPASETPKTETEIEKSPAGLHFQKIVWNPGLKVHQVKVDDVVVFESADKQEAEAWIKAA